MSVPTFPSAPVQRQESMYEEGHNPNNSLLTPPPTTMGKPGLGPTNSNSLPTQSSIPFSTIMQEQRQLTNKDEIVSHQQQQSHQKSPAITATALNGLNGEHVDDRCSSSIAPFGRSGVSNGRNGNDNGYNNSNKIGMSEDNGILDGLPPIQRQQQQSLPLPLEVDHRPLSSPDGFSSSNKSFCSLPDERDSPLPHPPSPHLQPFHKNSNGTNNNGTIRAQPTFPGTFPWMKQGTYFTFSFCLIIVKRFREFY